MGFNLDFQIFRVEDLLRVSGCSRVKFGDRKRAAIPGLMIWYFLLLLFPFEKVVGNEASQKLSGKKNLSSSVRGKIIGIRVEDN